jgi:Permuted papain-like amidase enzyme, YaeF/YiiX, C92 family
MARIIILSFVLFGFQFGCSKPIYPKSIPSKLQPGDLLFQDLDCGDLCTAIEKVTRKKGYPAISHVAIVEKIENGKIIIIEALKSVKRIDFKTFAQRSRDSSGRAKIVIARVKKGLKRHVPFLLHEIKMRLGKPYDSEFLPDNGAYYCSELISDSFASIGVDIFKRKPMFFGKEGSWALKIWRKYFDSKKKIIPSGKPGTNPMDIMTSSYLKIIYNYDR